MLLSAVLLSHLYSLTILPKCLLEDSSSNQVEDCKDNPVIDSDVIDITKCREDTPPGDTCHQAVTLDNKNEVQIQKPQEEKSPACQNQQVFCGKELPNETKDASSDSLEKFNKGNVFLLDATKEGNVGRFLNVSMWAKIPISKHIFSLGFFTK